MENEIITKDDAVINGFVEMTQRTIARLERFSANSRPVFGGEIYLTGEELVKRLHISSRTLQEYRNNGVLAYYKIGGKILYKESDVQKMLEENYNAVGVR